MATIKFLRRSNKVRKDGNAPIACRITEHRKHAYFNLAYSVKSQEWDVKRSRVKPVNPNYNRINLLISDTETRINEITLRNKQLKIRLTAIEIKQEVLGRTNEDFLSFAYAYIDEKYTNEDIVRSTYNKYLSVLKKLDSYTKGSLPILNVTKKFLLDYKLYLKNELGNNTNTISINLKCIRVIIKELVRQGLITVDGDPFKALRLKFKASKRKFLYTTELESIRELHLDDDTLIARVRSIFLFCLQTGLRIGDALFLRVEDFTDSQVRYYCQKSDSYETLPLTKVAQSLASSSISSNNDTSGFLFPFIDQNRLTDDLSILNEKKRKTALI